MNSLVGYGSGSDSEGGSGSDADADPFEAPSKVLHRAPVQNDSDSEEEVEEPGPAPEPKWKNAAIAAPSSSLLPSALDALVQAEKPKFLTPEATKPIAQLHRPKPPPRKWEEVELAPEEARAKIEDNKRKAAASGGLVAANAVLYKDKAKDEVGLDTSAVDPLALAMLGVTVPTAKKLKHSVVLGTGEKGKVKEAEKNKRLMGQNGRESVEWKSEEEMILRQQYDC